MFVIFAVTFIVSRLVLFPFHVVINTFFQAPSIMDTAFLSAQVFRLLLCVLIVLHCIWAWTIIVMVSSDSIHGIIVIDLAQSYIAELETSQRHGVYIVPAILPYPRLYRIFRHSFPSTDDTAPKG